MKIKLFSISIIAIIAFGLLPKLIAENTQINAEDGSSVQINPDGSKNIKKPDGTKIELKPGD